MSAIGGNAFPTYSADMKKDLPFLAFADTFEIVSDSFGLSNARKAQVLARCLRGLALVQFQTDTKEEDALKSDYKALKAKLAASFKLLEGGERFASCSFYSRKQGNNESVAEFFAALKSLSTKSFPDPLHPVPDGQMLESFVRGLITPYRRGVIRKECKTTREALVHACKLQAQRDFLDEEHLDAPIVAAVTQKPSDHLTKQIEQLTLTVNQVVQSQAALSESNRFHRDRQDWPNPDHHLARDNNRHAADKQKAIFDRRTRPSTLQAGDRVYLNQSDPQGGIAPKFQAKLRGPYVILNRLGHNVLIRTVRGTKGLWVHIDHCQLHEDRSADPVTLRSSAGTSVLPVPRSMDSLDSSDDEPSGDPLSGAPTGLPMGGAGVKPDLYLEAALADDEAVERRYDFRERAQLSYKE